MSLDTIQVTPGSGPPVSFENMGGGSNYYQIVKMSFGGNGVVTLVDANNGLPISSAALGAAADAAASTDTGTFSLISLFKRLLQGVTTLLGRAPDMVATVPANNVSAPPVRAVGQDVWNVSFSDVGASVLAPELKPTGYPITGTGISYSQANGNLAIVAGTTANAEFLTRSVLSWQGALRLKFSIVASQRIAQNNLAIMLADLVGEGLTYNIVSSTVVDVTKAGHGLTSQNVGQFMMLGGITGAAGVPGRYAIASIPDANTIRFTVAGWPGSGSGTLTLFGHSYVRNLFTSTVATNESFDCQRRGWADAAVTATINTTASPGTVIANECTGRELFLFDQLRASTTTPTVASRASRLENIPDNNLPLYVFIWNYNGTSNPATSTTWTISFMAVEKYANTPVYVQGARANGGVNPIPVSFPTVPAVSQSGTWTVQPGNTANTTPWLVSTRPTASVTGANSKHRLVTATSTNATSVKASAGMLYELEVVNNDATNPIYVKLYNKASAPTVGTDTPTETYRVNAGATLQLSWANGNPFSTGLAYAVTSGSADADTSAVAAGSLVHMKYS